MPSRLLVPQQWEHQANKNYPKTDGIWYATKAYHCTLYWNQERYCRTIPWDPADNIAIIRSDPSSNSYQVFVAAYEQEKHFENIENICYENIVSEDEEYEDRSKQEHNPEGPTYLFTPI